MSRIIEQDRIDDGDLTYAEAMYLKDRGLLPADYEMPDDDGSDVNPEVPIPGTVSAHTPLEEQELPAIGTSGGIVDEDYEEGWNNESRRAELAKRGLNVDGKKEDLMARLVRSDRDELEDDDLTEA